MQEHIAYYRRLIAEDPQNIDAHLRLGAIWRQKGEVAEAVRAYNSAARLLAEKDLELEAIAACRAVFELDPNHLETKLFLAQLYARRPSASVVSVIGAVEPEVPEEPEELIVLLPKDAVNEIGEEELELIDLDAPLAPVDEEETVTTQEIRALPRESQEILLDGEALKDVLESIEDISTDGIEAATFGEIEDLVIGSIQTVLDQSAPMVTGRPAVTGADVEEAPHEDVLEQEGPISIDGVDIPNTPLFSRLPSATFMTLLKRMHMRRVRAGECIINENVRHNTLYIILSGTVRVERRTPEGIQALATMERGEFFGEFELLTGQSPKVYVRAESPVALLEIPQSLIARIAVKDPTIWQVLWNFYHERLLNNLLAGSSLFGALNGDERAALANEFNRVEAAEGNLIMRQGQPSEGLYLIARGEVEVKHDHHENSNVVATLREGDFFGTVSSVTRSPVMATVRATRDTTLLFLRRARLSALTQRHPEVDVALRRLVAYRQIVVGKTGYSRMGLPK